MKKPLSYILTYFLGLLLLVSTAGVPVFAHICTSAGSKEVSVIPVESCCSGDETEDENSCEKPKGCCEEEVKFLQTEFPAIKTSQVEKPTAPTLDLLPLLKAIYSFSLPGNLNYNSYLSDAGPPLQSGRSILHNISILRI